MTQRMCVEVALSPNCGYGPTCLAVGSVVGLAVFFFYTGQR